MNQWNRERAFRLLALCGMGGLLVFSAEGACASRAPEEPAAVAGGGGGGSSRDSGSDSSKGGSEAGATAEAGMCSTPDTPLPSGTPAGWSWLPCIPSSCQIVMAPDPARANPPLEWASCGKGCLKYSHMNIDVDHAIGFFKGANGGGVRYVAYEIASGDPREIQVVRLPDNVVVFDAIAFGGLQGCGMYLGAVTSNVSVVWISELVSSSPPINRRLVYSLDMASSSLRLLFDETSDENYQAWTISPNLWATAASGLRVLKWHDLSYAPSLETAWQSPDARVIKQLGGIESMVLLGTSDLASIFEVLAWDPVGGMRSLFGSSSASTGSSACCALTDGNNITWLEAPASAWHPDSATFDNVALMASPLATDKGALRSRKLRPSYQNLLGGGEGAIGGGYVLMVEHRQLPDPSKLILTRLSDGAFIVMSDPPAGQQWRTPLYVDEIELAAVRAPTAQGQPMSIVRQTIVDLGAFHPAEAWNDIVGQADAGSDGSSLQSAH